MTVKQPRPYHSPKRTEQAQATRECILTAAEDLFAEQGYTPVTMNAIARKADVSLATVYLHYPGKPAIIAAMADRIAAMDDLSVEHVEHAPDPMKQLEIGVRIIRHLNERSWLVVDLLRSAQGTNPELSDIWETWQQRHIHAVSRGIRAADAHGALRPNASVDEIIDIFATLSGTDVYRTLVRERGWTPDQYERWLFRICCIKTLGILPE